MDPLRPTATSLLLALQPSVDRLLFLFINDW